MLLKQKTYYDADPTYQREQTPNWYQQLPRTNALLVEELAGLVREKKVLEVGCGGGWLSHSILNAGGLSYVGFDFSQTAIEFALRQQRNRRARFFVGDALKSEAYAGDFDLIVAHQFAQCLIGADRSLWLGHAARALAEKGGALVLSSLVGIPEGIRPTLRPGTRVNRLKNRYFADRAELEQELKRAGFIPRRVIEPESHMAIVVADYAPLR